MLVAEQSSQEGLRPDICQGDSRLHDWYIKKEREHNAWMAVTWIYVSNEHMPNMNERSRWINTVHVCQVRRERSSAVHEQRHEQNRNGNRNRSNTRRYHHVRVKLQKFSSSIIFLTTLSIMKSFYRLFANPVICPTSLSRFFPLYSVSYHLLNVGLPLNLSTANGCLIWVNCWSRTRN